MVCSSPAIIWANWLWLLHAVSKFSCLSYLLFELGNLPIEGVSYLNQTMQALCTCISICCPSNIATAEQNAAKVVSSITQLSPLQLRVDVASVIDQYRSTSIITWSPSRARSASQPRPVQSCAHVNLASRASCPGPFGYEANVNSNKAATQQWVSINVTDHYR